MRYVIIALLLSGCSTVVPVTARFPEPPAKGAMTACPNLQKLTDNARLSDVANTITITISFISLLHLHHRTHRLLLLHLHLVGGSNKPEETVQEREKQSSV